MDESEVDVALSCISRLAGIVFIAAGNAVLWRVFGHRGA